MHRVRKDATKGQFEFLRAAITEMFIVLDVFLAMGNMHLERQG